MTMKDIMLFTEIAKRRKNENFLESLTIADYPTNMKQDQRRKLNKDVRTEAYPESMKERVVTTDDLLGMGFKGLDSNG